MLAMSACDSGPPRQALHVQPPPAVVRDVPQALSGTIGSEATFRGIDPVLVAGLGIVVGLSGTGGSENLDQSIAATMEREAARNGIGKGAVGANYPGMEDMSPSEFMRSKNIAVVLVEARVAPGAPEGFPFDVYVRTLPGSSVTSLEGGRLWTTDLRIGPAAVFGAVKSRRIAQASGPIFINPFGQPSVGPSGELQVTRTSGRILAGGHVTDPLQIEMALDNDSFARARSIVATINSRFPRERGDEGPIARGRGNSAGQAGYQSVALRIPRAYGSRPEEFLQLVRHMRVDSSVPEEFARQYVEALKSTPALADDLSWCLQAIGQSSLPFLHSMYDYPELVPRMAALRAGARLGDNRAATPLIELARRSTPGTRVQAMRLLRDMPSNPAINLALREIVNDPNLEIRVAAYEALRERSDSLIVRLPIGDSPDNAKFTLDLVPASEPMVYITQQGEPRIVLFGGVDPEWRPGRDGRNYKGIRVNKPILVSCWEDRFMLTAERPDAKLRVFYRNPSTGQRTQTEAPDDLPNLIDFLAHGQTPEDPRPGLGLSYSQVVGIIYELCPKPNAPTDKVAALSCTFATEEDRLRAEIFEAMQTPALSDRPETEQDAAKLSDSMFRPTAPAPLPSAAADSTSPEGLKARIIPLKKPAAPPK
jgi:flagellar basal body P-ring protein FlgI